MKQKESKKKGRISKQFTVVRNFGGNMTVEEYVARLARTYESKESHRK